MSRRKKERLTILGHRLQRSDLNDQPVIPREVLTLCLQPELRDRLDSAYFKLKANGSRISRPDFCEAIIETGLNDFDALPARKERPASQPMPEILDPALADRLAA